LHNSDPSPEFTSKYQANSENSSDIGEESKCQFFVIFTLFPAKFYEPSKFVPFTNHSSSLCSALRAKSGNVGSITRYLCQNI